METLQDVVSAAQEALDRWPGGPWWRGHDDAQWFLVPRIYRDGRPPGLERNVALGFRNRAPSRHTSCPGQDDLASWLLLMQHHGAPTRLLDWTESAMAAAFFAVSDARHHAKHGALWALNPVQLNHHQIDVMGLVPADDAHVHPLFTSAFTGVQESDRIVAFGPHEVDVRMLLQLSMFTIHGAADPIESLLNHDQFVMKFEIAAQAKRTIQRQLVAAGIKRSTLFPDLRTLAEELDVW